MSPPLKLASSHHIRGWHSLVYGQPSYMGQVYQSHPMQDYLCWRKMARQSPDDLPVKLPWGGKIGSCSLDCGHPPEHPPRMGEDHRQSDLAVDLRRNMYIRQRDNIYTC